MARQASPIERWEDETVGFKQPVLIINCNKVEPGKGIPAEGVDEVLDSVTESAPHIPLPALLDVIPMSELQPINQPRMSSSMVEFIGINNLDRSELDEEEHDQPTPPPHRAPFGTAEGEVRHEEVRREPGYGKPTPDFDAAVAEDPFSDG